MTPQQEARAAALDGIRDEVRDAVLEGDAQDCSSADCIADAVYEIVRVRLAAMNGETFDWFAQLVRTLLAAIVSEDAVAELDVERLAKAISLRNRRSYIDILDRLAAKEIAKTYARLRAAQEETP